MASKDEKKAQQIKQLYAELNKFGRNEEYDKAVKSANKSTYLCTWGET
jgi:hypothetical protein